MCDLLDKLKDITKDWNSDYFNKLAEDHYKEDRLYPENFSNWYPCIKHFGKFKSAKIIANQIFTLDEVKVFQETDRLEKANLEKLNEILKPTLDKMESYRLYSIKNGCYSNKFDFDTCVATKENLAEKLWKINYMSCMYDTGGYTELVVRELIPYDNSKTATIYNGMPLREELRVFYNMDKKQIEYVNDYWDYDYCIDKLHNKTDEIIFMWFHNKTRRRHEQHIHEINVMKQKIKDRIDTLKIDGLHGIWSIDFMLVTNTEKHNGIWLVDMARAERSTYWNKARLTIETKRELGIIGKKKEVTDENSI